MKKNYLLFLLTLLPLLARATAVEINGIYYNLDSKAKIAEVTENPNRYSGKLVIPKTVTDQEVSYNVTSIGEYAFERCTSLTSITIPNSVISIGEFAFVNCKALTSITIPNSVTSISYSLFRGCSSLTSITIPNSVISIESAAFRDCTSLTSITIPNSVISIGNSAFRGCSGLTSIIIPNSVTSIVRSPFDGCNKLTIIEIGSGITDIYTNVFFKLPELKDVYCYAENVPKTHNESSKGTYINATLHVPKGSVDAYKAVVPWSYFKEIVAISSEDATGIKSLEGAVTEPFDVYDMSGHKVLSSVTSINGLPNGIYIINGKKMIIK